MGIKSSHRLSGYGAGLICLAILKISAPAFCDEPLSPSEVQSCFEKAVQARKVGDLPEAMRWLRQAADNGHAQAQVDLGDLLDKAEFNEQAFELYQKAAVQDNIDGMFHLAMLYAKGEGVEKNQQLAMRWFIGAAEAGDARSQNLVARAYEFGKAGIPVNRDKALYWYRRAAENDFRDAVVRLIQVYEKGELGQGIDLEKAAGLRAKLP